VQAWSALYARRTQCDRVGSARRTKCGPLRTHFGRAMGWRRGL